MTEIQDPIAPSAPPVEQPRWWRSLEQLADPEAAAAAAANEFPEGASEPPVLDDVSRRRFLGLAAATTALAGMTSCRKPVTHIVPFARRPEDMVPGNPLYYATAHVRDGYGTGVLVKSSDGRPTKVEGNPLHPASLGATNQWMQAELLNLYDPARSTRTIHHDDRGHEHADPGGHGGHGEQEHHDRALKDLLADWTAHPPAHGGAKLRVLLEPTSSPALLAAVQRFQAKFQKAKVHWWAPVHNGAAVQATRTAFGKPLDTQYDLQAADVVVAVDCDFQLLDGDAVRYARDFATRRRITSEKEIAKLSRLYAIECTHSVTGSNADHRFRVRASEIGDVVMALAHELGKLGVAVPGDYAKFADLGASLNQGGKAWLPILAADLHATRGRCAVLVGPRLPAEVQVVLHAINHALGNVGKTVRYTATPAGMAEDCAASITDLAAALRGGSVDTLLILGGNPVYTAPADLDFAAALGKCKNSVHLSLFDDETSTRCTWHVPQAHDLEAWGDIRSRDGTATLMQPLIAPLYDGVSSLELLALLADGEAKVQVDGAEVARTGYHLVKDTWRPRATGSFETFWARALHDGVVPDTRSAEVQVAPQAAAIAAAAAARVRAPAGSPTSLEVGFRPDHSVHDGRYSNNSWLMELPDPMTKITWDNVALTSLRTLQQIGAKQGELVVIELSGRSLTTAIWVLPGHADFSLTLTLGYGRSLGETFTVAKDAGFNAYAVRTSAGHDLATGATVTPTGRSYKIAVTQEHGMMEGRAIVREQAAPAYAAQPDFAALANPLERAARAHNAAHKASDGHDHKDGDGHGEPQEHGKLTADDFTQSLWKETALPKDHWYDPGQTGDPAAGAPYQWGMVIDLNTCIGCNACIAACASENNISMVGKTQVAKGREMFWLRVDRYFGDEASGNATGEGLSPELNPIPRAENPKVVHQAVPCMQCERASCEVVCPVAATVHSPEGLNDMAYNRCIGTRYCGNNCPYKVRKFNYLDFDGEVPPTIRMTRNPDVTIRSRGVMEKCTYCVQRINRGKIEARRDGRRMLQDGDVQTACEQSCPTQAITFGNIRDPESRVSRLKRSNLNYGLLAELNMRPRTTYLAKIRNPNPKLA